MSAHVKDHYDYACQVCGETLEIPAGRYAEGAHIRPLGRPHNGPDMPENCLCLCPNHHVLFDQGAFSIGDDFKFVGLRGRLNVAPRHKIAIEHLAYHREKYFRKGR